MAALSRNFSGRLAIWSTTVLRSCSTPTSDAMQILVPLSISAIASTYPWHCPDRQAASRLSMDIGLRQISYEFSAVPDLDDALTERRNAQSQEHEQSGFYHFLRHACPATSTSGLLVRHRHAASCTVPISSSVIISIKHPAHLANAFRSSIPSRLP